MLLTGLFYNENRGESMAPAIGLILTLFTIGMGFLPAVLAASAPEGARTGRPPTIDSQGIFNGTPAMTKAEAAKIFSELRTRFDLKEFHPSYKGHRHVTILQTSKGVLVWLSVSSPEFFEIDPGRSPGGQGALCVKSVEKGTLYFAWTGEANESNEIKNPEKFYFLVRLAWVQKAKMFRTDDFVLPK